ncbi:MAG: ATP-binding protein [Candidatus Aenigmatarchaeota archaeon]
MLINLKNKKMLIAGIQGTGKTYLAKFLSKPFKTMVYTPYLEEWKDEKVVLVRYKDFVQDYPFWCSQAIKFAKAKKINLFITDDADILFRHHFDTSQELREMVIGHRHYGLALIFVTRRIQDIPTRIYGIMEFFALFTIEEPNAIAKLNQFYDGLGDLVKSLPYKSYQFILKEIGKKPVRCKV